MASASSLAHFQAAQAGDSAGFETIEIDPQFCQGLGLAQGDLVEIGLLHDLGVAQSVATEPVTSDDWEIIEIHASLVESTLLSQVRVAKVGQEIDVWVMGRTRVRLIVTGIDPAKGNALLLTTNTEVSIAPKLHKSTALLSGKDASNSKQRLNKPVPTGSTVSERQAPNNSSSKTLRVLPARLVSTVAFPEPSGTEFLSFIAPNTFGDQPPATTGTKIKFRRGQLRRLSPPSDPSSSEAAPQDTSPKSLNLGSSAGDKAEDKSGSTGGKDILIALHEDIPPHHIILSALPEGVEEWDLVRVSAEDNTFETRSFSNILAGVGDILGRCTEYCIREYLGQADRPSVYGVSGLLVTGRQGAGKTSIVRAVAKSLQENPETLAYTYYIDVSRHTEQPIATVKGLFTYWFDRASWHRPSVLILDNLDKLLSAEVEHADSYRSRLLTEVFIRLFSSSYRTTPQNSQGILLIATASSMATLHSRINTSHIFKEVVNVKPPNKDARKDILSRIVKDRLQVTGEIQQSDNLNFSGLAMQTEGYSASDLQDLVSRAMHQVAIRLTNDPNSAGELSYEDFTSAQADFVPLTLRDVKLEKSDTSWNDIGGLFETRQVLRETLEWPTKYGPIFAQSPLRLRSGILLYGYPGCGKTLLASAVAKECGLNFISVKGPEILNKYIGASEKSVRDLFERASAAKPCVLFFDEFDSIAPKRGHDSTGVTDRVVNQMLTQMDGAEGLDGVYVLAATSRPDLIDSALLRPGRLDKSILCNMPDFEDRKDILQAVARKLSISPDTNFDRISELTEGFSGADLQALLYNAHLGVVHAAIEAAPSSDDQRRDDDEKPLKYHIFGGDSEGKVMSRAESTAFERRIQSKASASLSASKKREGQLAIPAKAKHEILEENIVSALKGMRSSVPPDERRRLDRIYKEFVSDRSGELPVPPEGVGIGNRATLA
ncbi:peroxisome biogenesis factor 1 [Ephemerocybe angulata]|uniref:Peroxisomal ATPase PEX1 n=1 Tax=Ephemerocybe angulata TaxID=980116 RepID=A0A8H6I780_9AGAR|nr:peroxisome biogenesis factor 1 [Tulosesus angulatus]